MYNNFVFCLITFFYKYFFVLYKEFYYIYKNFKDKSEIALLKKWVRPGDCVIDIGANIGFYSSLFSRLVGSRGSVHAFEPDKQNFKHLRDIVAGLRNVKINMLAVSDLNGPINIYTSKESNTDHRSYFFEEYDEFYKSRSTRLDDYIKGRFKVDLIKMDIQGAEYSALRGMSKTLGNNHDIILLMEYWPEGLKRQGVTIDTVTAYFKKLGMRIYVIGENGLKKLGSREIQKYKTYKYYDFDNWFITRNERKDIINRIPNKKKRGA